MEKQQPEIYFANRGEAFKNMIRKVLSKSKLKPHYIDLLTDDQSMKLYAQAFTHTSVNPNKNYEFLETLGDQIANTSIVWYLSRRFPQINCEAGVKIISRLKINFVSKEYYFNFAQGWGFWPFISADENIRNNEMKATLEDVFEAFFGATTTLLDSRVRLGVGYPICYNIIENLFNKMDISLKYEDLFDPKTRLKELFEYKKFNIGTIDYTSDVIDRFHYARAVQKIRGRNIIIGKGSATKKAPAEQKAAKQALAYMKRKGFEKPVSEAYKMFCLPSQFKI